MIPSNLPNFLIIGAAKAGTSSLDYYLKQHPMIYLSKTKEPHFFDYSPNYQKGLKHYVKKHFKGAEKYPARGEATPSYLQHFEIVIPRISEAYNGDLPKFIIMLRDPVERAWSHYLHRTRNYRETETFERALELEGSRLEKNKADWVGYFSDGLYSQQIDHWLMKFPIENFLFILSDDMKFKHKTTLKSIFDFLGVDSNVDIPDIKKMNVASTARSEWLMKVLSHPPLFTRLIPYSIRRNLIIYLRNKNLRPYDSAPKMDMATKEKLRKKYAPEISRLEKIIERDLSMWNSKQSMD